ncbi:MAG: flippase-like domain-containing protein [Planctomycetia bacterium]|nr:flippase-like domain-containing protein [Planctomycetia bacterium]
MKNVFKNKIFTGLLKFGLAAGILGYLIYDASRKEEFLQMLDQPKNFGLIAAGFALFFCSVIVSIMRWRLLVRALEFPFTVKEALRLGFLGYLLNFVAPGGVGGDLFKAVAIARNFPGRRAQAAATVVLDRIIGLYALFLVASTAVVVDGLWFSDSYPVRVAAKSTLISTIVGAIGIVMLLIPGFTSGKVSQFLARLPKVGPVFHQLLEAVRMYRERLGTIFATLCLSISLHILTVFGYFLLGKAIVGESPTLSEQFVIVPLAAFAGALPITPNGLGTFEAAIEYLYPTISKAHIPAARGLLVSLMYRLVTIGIALIGVVIYFFSRREVGDTLHVAEEPGGDLLSSDAPSNNLLATEASLRS